MAVRHMLLVVSAVAVLAMGVYLALEVSRSESAPAVITSTPAPTPVAPPTPASEPPRKPRRVEPPARVGSAVAVEEPAVEEAPTKPLKPTQISPERLQPIFETNRELQEQMAAANKAYDKQRMDEARSYAEKVLAVQPENTRMLRVMVSSWCIEGESDQANIWFAKLPEADKDAMRTRCERYGVTFN